MLVLMRRTDESVVINDNVEIKVLKIEEDRVHLKITTPDEVYVLPAELLDDDGGGRSIEELKATLGVPVGENG